MGLDMYAFTCTPEQLENPDAQVDLKIKEGEPEELAYWRKCHQLHGWMERLYRQKGGLDPDFNCNTVRLMPEDLDKLEQALANRETELPATEGFFFGGGPWEEGDDANIRQFIAHARANIEAGRIVIYDSWW